MIERTADPGVVNELVGVDFSEVLAEPLHVCLIDGSSGAIFMWRGPGIYEVHVFFEVRGREALDLGAAMLARMESDHGGRLFWAMVPDDDRKVKMFTRLMGWKSLGVRDMRHGPNELFVQEISQCLHS